MHKSVVNALKFIVFLSLGLGILYYVYHQQQVAYAAECALRGLPESECSLLDKVINDFAGANFWWLAVVLLCFTISNLSRALRWNMLLRQFGTEPRLVNAFLTINLGYFANLGLPRIGEVVRAGTMARYEKISVEKVMGTIVVDRLIDVITILLVTALSVALASDQIWGWVAQNAVLGEKLASVRGILTGLAVTGLVTLYLIYHFRKKLQQNALFAKVFDIIKGFGEGLKTILKLDNPLLFFFHSINIWLMYYLMTYCCLLSFAPTENVGAVAALVTFVAGGWGIVVPSPGGMGSYHFMAQAALTLFGVAGDDAFSWSNISFFTINLGCNVAIGLLALLLLPRINQHYDPQPVNG